MTGPSSELLLLDDQRLQRAGLREPRLTFVVTCYNYAPYVEQCLTSIARQTYPHFSCVVVDDASEDESPSIIQRFADSNLAAGRFSMIRMPENGGQMAAIVAGVNEIGRSVPDSTFTAIIDADDVLLEDFAAAHLRAHLGPDVVAFSSANQYQINEQGEVTAGAHLDLQHQRFRVVRDTRLNHLFWYWGTASSMTHRTATLRLVLPTDPKALQTLRICADYYIAQFANHLGGSLLIPTIHGCYRRHGGNGFACNPIIGGSQPVGDMRTHPAHEEVRRLILARMLELREDLTRIYMEHGFLELIYRMGDWEFVRDCIGNNPETFPKPVETYHAHYHQHKAPPHPED